MDNKGYNLNKLFYKDYYNGISFEYAISEIGKPSAEEQNKIKATNDRLLKARLPQNNLLEKSLSEIAGKNDCFELEVCYPGLITGIGMVHDSKKLEGAFNLGMHFNYTYGIPVIYGSTIKGILRSYFKEFYKGKEADAMLADIFEGINNGKPKPVGKRDIFLDAVLVKGCEKRNGTILDTDSITSHKEGALKEPNPVTFLKIAAGCKIKFFFRFCKSEVNGVTLTESDKRDLFKEILLNVGAGAKTNVGYGQFKETDNK